MIYFWINLDSWSNQRVKLFGAGMKVIPSQMISQQLIGKLWNHRSIDRTISLPREIRYQFIAHTKPPIFWANFSILDALTWNLTIVFQSNREFAFRLSFAICYYIFNFFNQHHCQFSTKDENIRLNRLSEYTSGWDTGGKIDAKHMNMKAIEGENIFKFIHVFFCSCINKILIYLLAIS